jgi:hypothetical protein
VDVVAGTVEVVTGTVLVVTGTVDVVVDVLVEVLVDVLVEVELDVVVDGFSVVVVVGFVVVDVDASVVVVLVQPWGGVMLAVRLSLPGWPSVQTRSKVTLLALLVNCQLACDPPGIVFVTPWTVTSIEVEGWVGSVFSKVAVTRWAQSTDALCCVDQAPAEPARPMMVPMTINRPITMDSAPMENRRCRPGGSGK